MPGSLLVQTLHIFLVRELKRHMPHPGVAKENH